jgi:ABC-type siderophore export system fused ATPase/permease subunit
MSEEMKTTAMQLLELQMATDNLKTILPLVLERQQAIAKVRKAKFDAAIEAGFTEQQAIEIVSKTPILE